VNHSRTAVRLAVLAVVAALASCGPRPIYAGKSVAQLQAELTGPPAGRAAAALGLSRQGPAAVSAVPELVAALTDPDAAVRQNAALALGSVGPDAAEVLPGLTAALGDAEWAVRRQAAVTLGKLGRPAAPAEPALKKLARDPNAQVRKAAADALKQIVPAPPRR
jgi:HEAT repeat protein